MLPNVFVSDVLPYGMTYYSSSPGSTHTGQNVYWSDIGPMPSGSTKILWIRATIDGTVYGTMTNLVDVEGKPEYGDNVTDDAKTYPRRKDKIDTLWTWVNTDIFSRNRSRRYDAVPDRVCRQTG